MRWIFYFNPSFPLSLLFGLVTRIGCNHMHFSGFSWEEGRKYELADFFHGESGFDATGIAYDVPSPFFIITIQFLVSMTYFLLTWYFDHVISSNRGVSE